MALGGFLACHWPWGMEACGSQVGPPKRAIEPRSDVEVLRRPTPSRPATPQHWHSRVPPHSAGPLSIVLTACALRPPRSPRLLRLRGGWSGLASADSRTVQSGPSPGPSTQQCVASGAASRSGWRAINCAMATMSRAGSHGPSLRVDGGSLKNLGCGPSRAEPYQKVRPLRPRRAQAGGARTDGHIAAGPEFVTRVVTVAALNPSPESERGRSGGVRRGHGAVRLAAASRHLF